MVNLLCYRRKLQYVSEQKGGGTQQTATCTLTFTLSVTGTDLMPVCKLTRAPIDHLLSDVLANTYFLLHSGTNYISSPTQLWYQLVMLLL